MNYPPPAVLTARLDHELNMSALLLEAAEYDLARIHMERAQGILAQLEGALK